MTKRCLDEAVLQAYLDGELSHERAAEAASHLAACDACAAALDEAGQETSLFAAAFAPDESVNVPSEVLRSRINAAVARLESQAEPGRPHSQGRDFGGFFASLAGLFTPRGAAAFASLLAVVALALVYFAAQKSRREASPSQARQEVAQTASVPQSPSVVTATGAGTAPPPAAPPAYTPGENLSVAPTSARAKHSPRRATDSGARPRAKAPAPKEEALPGEKDYQTAIASLEKTIKLGGDESLRPALRADYERSLALLDTAISQTRQVAARNPKDETAVSFLMAAYQSKVELLSKVADQAQVAALGR